MCDDCVRKQTTILAAVFATGTVAFAADDNDPEENQHDRDSMPDIAELLRLQVALAAAQQGPPANYAAEAETIGTQLSAFYNRIGGYRFSYAVTVMLFMLRSIDAARGLGAEFIQQLAATTDAPGPRTWMAKYGMEHGLVPEMPQEIAEAMDMLRRAGAQVTMVGVPVPGQRRDKPVGTGPNGEAH